ncbi:MAG: hypothetical protein R2847_03025 [Bacteroidia bacterium]
MAVIFSYDQKYRHNLQIRKDFGNYIRNIPRAIRLPMTIKSLKYMPKDFFFSNGIHHHYSADKIIPEFS